MGYDFRVIQVDNKKRKRIKATCESCAAINFVRRDFAVGQVKKNQLEYSCKLCSSKKNIKKARKETMDNAFVNEFIWLCEQIFVNLYDDLHPKVIAKKLDSTSINFIEMAREFVYDYIHTGIDNQVIECTERMESGESQALIDMYDWVVELKARALLSLESLPRPEGL